MNEHLRVALAQTEVSGEVPTAAVLRESGERVRAHVKEAAAAGARLVQLPEGAIGYPTKRAISSRSPELAEADWSKVDWDALRHELDLTADLAGELGVWVVVGAPHRLGDGRRPHNSLYVLSDRGDVVTRYDKRMLSTTEITYMCTPGTEAVAFEVDGFRFGLAICLELLFPELFVEYAAMDVDGILVSASPSPAFRMLAEAHAVMNATVVTLAMSVDGRRPDRSGAWRWTGCLDEMDTASPGIVTVDIPHREPEASFHRKARSGLYDGWYATDDPRSLDRGRL